VTSSMTALTETLRIIVGVDTHKYVHVAVAIDSLGVRVEDRSFPVDTGGYKQLSEWAESLGRVTAFGVEGTGSYGAGLTSLLRRQGHQVVEVNRGNRQTRRTAGKSDTADAEVAARQVLAGVATAVPKTADGQVEILRQVKVARDTAVKARTSAIITLKQIIVNAPAELREQLAILGDKALISRCAGFRVGQVTDTTTSAKYTLRALARRWQTLNVEIVDADRVLDRITTETAPTLRQAFGIGPDTAAEMLIVFGDNPERIHPEAAFAKLCGACPIPASSGMTDGRHRLYRGGHRQANAALYRSVIVRMRFHQPTIDYVKRRTAEGLGKREIIRCIKRYLAREIYQHVMADHRTRLATQLAT
jgi:transposase